ncbi:MAG: Hsp33 family molecular chaperone HslO [Oscillospiraceae bacterium]
MGKLIRIITSDGAVLAAAIDSTDLAARAEQVHTSSATVTAAMGRLMAAASMMGAMMKNQDDSITLRMAGGGPIGSLIAVSDRLGNARVTVTNPVVELPLNAKGKLDVAGAVGTDGLLSVIRDYKNGETQTGHSPIVSGEIGEDITYYFAASEQIPTVCALGVLVNPDLSVCAAGGILLQLLPGADDGIIEQIERNLTTLPSVSSMIQSGLTPMQMLEKALAGFELELLEELAPEYRCNCSRERVERVLISLGKDELRRLGEERETTSVQCHFCEKRYDFTADQLAALSSPAS